MSEIIPNVGDVVAFTFTITDDQTPPNTRTFSGSTVVQAVQVAPVAQTAPTITGNATEGETVTINEGTYSGTPAPTISGALTLNGVNVSEAMVGMTYTIPAGTAAQSLQWSETAANGVAPNASQSVSVTIQAAAVDPDPEPTDGPELLAWSEGPRILGDTTEGAELTLDLGVWDQTVTGFEIGIEQISPSATLLARQSADGDTTGMVEPAVGSSIILSVWASSATGTTLATSNPFGPIEAAA